MKTMGTTKLATRTLLSLAVAAAVAGCSDDDDNNNTTAERSTGSAEVQTGTLISDDLSNVAYKTATQTGYTSSTGEFNYVEGETVTFYVGDIAIGQATADATIALGDVTLTTDASTTVNPEYVERFLQSLDADNNLENGVEISEFTHTQADGQMLDFSLPLAEFESQADALVRMLTPNVARLLTANTTIDWSGTVDADGVMTGVFIGSDVNNVRFETATQAGYTNDAGEFQYESGQTVSFYVGDVMLGTAQASSYVTPQDFLADVDANIAVSDQVVENVLRFLQTLDVDGDGSNGIYIAEDTHAEAVNSLFTFDQTRESFEAAINPILGLALSITNSVLVGVQQTVDYFADSVYSQQPAPEINSNEDDSLESELDEAGDSLEENAEELGDSAEENSEDLGNDIEEMAEDFSDSVEDTVDSLF